MIASKSKYKETGLRWFTEIPEHWEVKRLGGLFEERNETVSENDYAPLSVTMKGIVPQLESAAKTMHVDNRKKVCIGDFAINSRSDRRGSGGLSNLEGSVSIVNTVLKPCQYYVPEYTHYLLTNKLFQDEYYAKGKGIVADMWSTRFSEMKTIYLPVPPKDEQDEIVQYIKAQEEKIDLFIQKKQRFIELLKEQRQSKIDEAFDGTNKIWLTKKLKYIAEIKFSNVDKHTIEDEIPVRLCNYVDVYKNDYITNDLEFMIATATETEIEKFRVLKGDVIITKDSEEATDIAVPAFVKENLENVVCGYHLALIRANENEILSEYLFRKFQSNELKAYFAIEATGVTRVGLSMGEITGIKIGYPKSLEEQKQIVSHIKTETATIDTAIAKAEREIELIREYKEAMVSEAVMGKRKLNFAH